MLVIQKYKKFKKNCLMIVNILRKTHKIKINKKFSFLLKILDTTSRLKLLVV
jgi:hypothetical protein